MTMGGVALSEIRQQFRPDGKRFVNLSQDTRYFLDPMADDASTGTGTKDKDKKYDDDIYDGDLKDGKRHGYGQLTKKVPPYPPRTPNVAHK